MMESEMNHHLGYKNPNVLTLPTTETVTRKKQSIRVQVPCGLKSHKIANPYSNLQVVKKRQKDISKIDQKDHLHICQGNDNPTDIRNTYGYLWF